MAVAQTDEQRRAVVANGIGTGDEQQVAHRADKDSLRGIVYQSPLAQLPGSLQAGEDQSDGQQHEVGSRAARDAHHLLAVDGQIVRQHAVAESEEGDVHTDGPSAQEEEAVPRQPPPTPPREGRTAPHPPVLPRQVIWSPSLGGVRGGFLRCIDGRHHGETGTGHDKGEPEQQVEAVDIAVDEDADGRCDGRGDVVADAVVADALGASR